MKSRAQKTTELEKGKKLLKDSKFLVFADFTKITSEDLRRLRTELKKLGANFLVIKKRLLGILLKEKGAKVDTKEFKVSMGTVFSSEVDKAAGPVYRFFKEFNPAMAAQKILGGYDLENNRQMDATEVLAIGTLPSREVLLTQLVRVVAAPLRSLMYVLSERSKQTVKVADIQLTQDEISSDGGTGKTEVENDNQEMKQGSETSINSENQNRGADQSVASSETVESKPKK